MKAIAKIFVVVALISATSVSAFAGPTVGPLVGTERVSAHSAKIFYQSFRAGETATVSIVGDGDTDLDLFIYDANNNLIARATGLSDRETVTFVPFVTSQFRVEVRNLGNVWNQFTIAMR